MSFIHYLYLGHFEHDGEVMRFSKYRPVIRTPLDDKEFEAVLREVKGAGAEDLGIPEEWAIWQEDGYLVCDKYTRNREEIDFITRLVERTHCDIHDKSAHCDITLREWLETLREWLELTHSSAKL